MEISQKISFWFASIRFPQLRGYRFRAILAAWLLISLVINFASANQITITIGSGIYRPGMRAQGIGPPLVEMAKAIAEYEHLHPNVRIIFQGEGGNSTVESEYIKAQILGGIAPDIVRCNAEVVWPDVAKGWWVPLDKFLKEPNPYVPAGEPGAERWADLFDVPALFDSQRGPDGQLYSLPYDLVAVAIFYNRDIFSRLSLMVPRTWEELMTVCEKLRAGGYTPMVMRPHAPLRYAQNYLFDQLHYPLYPKLDREKKPGPFALTSRQVAGLIEKGWFAADSERYREMFRLLKEWRRHMPRDITSTDPNRLFLTQRAAMYLDGSWTVRQLVYSPMVTFEWGVFGLPPVTTATTPLASSVQPAVIGGAGVQFSITRLAHDRGHLEQVIDFLHFITVPSRAAAIISEAGTFIPNMKGVEMPERLAPFKNLVRARHNPIKWHLVLDNRFIDTNRRLLELYLAGGIDLDAFMQRMEANNRTSAHRLIAQAGWRYESPAWGVDAKAEESVP